MGRARGPRFRRCRTASRKARLILTCSSPATISLLHEFDAGVIIEATRRLAYSEVKG